MNIIECKNLTKEYLSGENTVVALNDVSLEFEKGEFCAITGPSGSGKSTFLHVLSSLENATSGEVIYNNESLKNYNDNQLSILRRRRFGFVFQAYNLLEEHTVKENILMPLHLDGRDIEPEFLKELVEALEISDKLDRYPDQLSGGEQQRVAIARALASKPAILLADEPTGNLDPKTGDQVLRHLKALAARFHQTILLVTHDMEIAAMADRVIRLHNGEVIETKDN